MKGYDTSCHRINTRILFEAQPRRVSQQNNIHISSAMTTTYINILELFVSIIYRFILGFLVSRVIFVCSSSSSKYFVISCVLCIYIEHR